MKAIDIVDDGIDVASLRDAVLNRYDLFAMCVARQSFAGSPHADTMTIFLRGPMGWSREWYQQDVGAMDYPAMRILETSVREVLVPVVKRLDLREIGRVMIVELPAGGQITEHCDEGAYSDYYKRWHLCLTGGPKATLTCDGETVACLPGRLIWFNHKLQHSARNDEAHARLQVIIDGVPRE